jgi:NtrC-family two-component system response regulator AlgB
MERALATARQAAVSDVPVLLIGEIGTGKSTLAAAIHRWSPRREGPFITLPCTALADGFRSNGCGPRQTGSPARRADGLGGKLDAASGGTLFLDEIADFPYDLQFELVRLLGDQPGNWGALDARIVAATHRDLQAEVHAGRFREDLFFRLSVVTIALPPLRERPEDLPMLVERLLEQLVERHGRGPFALTPEVLRALAGYAWPGNARELANVLERAVVLATGTTITTAELPDSVLAQGGASAGSTHGSLEELERQHVRQTLAESPTLEEAAARLGINASTLWRKRKRWGLE